MDTAKLVAVRDARVVPVVTQWRALNGSLRFVDGRTVLRWTPVAASGQPLQASGFTVDLATDAAFNAQLRRTVTAQAETSLGLLPAGPYFVRFKANLPDGKLLESEIYSFELPGDWGYTVVDLAAALKRVP
jgi:hypothetical protein